MITPDDVRKLAQLARLSVPEERLGKLVTEFEAILGYVSQIDALEVPPGTTGELPYRNVLRSDGDPHEEGAWTAPLVDAFPRQEDNLLVVKQILSHDS